MCLKISNQFRTRALAKEHVKEPLISKRNITVYKILEKVNSPKGIEFISPFRCMTYLPGETKIVKKFSFEYIDACGWKVNVNKGLHTLNSPSCIASNIMTAKSFVRFTAKMKYSAFGHNKNMIIVECIIPKGTPYYKNEEEYVSLALQMPDKFVNVYKK